MTKKICLCDLKRGGVDMQTDEFGEIEVYFGNGHSRTLTVMDYEGKRVPNVPLSIFAEDSPRAETYHLAGLPERFLEVDPNKPIEFKDDNPHEGLKGICPTCGWDPNGELEDPFE